MQPYTHKMRVFSRKILTTIQLLLLLSICIWKGADSFSPAVPTTSSSSRRSHSSFSLSSLQRHHKRISSSPPLFMTADGGGGGKDEPLKSSLNSNWNDNDDDKSASNDSNNDVGFFDFIRRWFRSEEGQEDIQIYLTSLAVALLLRFTIIEPRYIPSLSMYPTFEVGDQLAVEKVTKRLKPFYRNEVVVFNPPQAFKDIVEGQYGDKARAREALIKRIVAVEGDRVEVKKGKLFINGEQADEPFVAEDAQYQFGPVVVPPNHVLVLGDNRNHSLDGHIWGFLPKRNVIGRAVFVYWPPWRLGNDGMY